MNKRNAIIDTQKLKVEIEELKNTITAPKIIEKKPYHVRETI